MKICNICNLRFENSKIYANHVRWSHKSNEKQCPYCKNNYEILMQHKKTCNLNPKNIRKCINCFNVLLNNENKKFCSRQCSGTYNTSKRTKEYLNQIKEKHKINTKNATCKICKISIKINFRASIKNSCCSKCKRNTVYNCTCNICNKFFKSKNKKLKTCSRECYIKNLSINSKNNPNCGGETNFKRFYYNGIMFDSTWEVEIAKFLDENNIKWKRSRSIILYWIDSKNQKRRYYPDFYLPDYDLYIDPKNSYKQKLDKEKIDYISERYNLIIGNVQECKNKIDKELKTDNIINYE